MTPPRKTYRPKRSVRHEIYSLAIVLIAPLLITCFFPYHALGWRASEHAAAPRTFCAFISLSEAESDAAIASARAAIRTAAERVNRVRADLTVADVPEAEIGETVAIDARAKPVAGGTVFAGEGPLPPSQAADFPARLKSGDRTDESAARRCDLLAIPDFLKGTQKNDDTRRSP